ncbi:hypothetical protein BX666DRAFT_1964635 [Dichotomocladium elegans]|nr:hypothetical protein BX666DRAFT_1964635 [Dichotomocladium elegans]
MANESSVPHLEKDGHAALCSPSPPLRTAIKPNAVSTTGSTDALSPNDPVSENPQRQSVIAGPAQEYLVKAIQWFDFPSGRIKDVRIITQNENGPCPLVAICNVLFLRGDLEIQPPDRNVVTFEYLVERLGDYLLSHGPTHDSNKPSAEDSPSPIQQEGDTDAPRMLRADSKQSNAPEYVLTYRYNLDAALSILPNLQMGLDVNVRFSSIRGFEPTDELAMFDLFGVDLVHGWVADPQDYETYRVVVEKCGSYNSVVECVVRGDTLSSSNSQNNKHWTADEDRQIHEGLVATSFLDDTATQLTYYGLQMLADTVPANKLFVLFRNNHFSTLFKHPDTGGLFILVTDQGLVNEKSIVWESLGDIDQGSSEFFDGKFNKPQITQALPNMSSEENDELDYALALSLQQQEISSADERRRSQLAQPPSAPQQQQQQQQQHTERKAAAATASSSKQKNCIIC